MIVYNSAQVNRISKMYDQVEALDEPYLPGRLFLSSGNYPVTSLLPDLNIINELISQSKTKLKAIDEVANSKKNDVVKFKGSKTASSNRSESKKAVEISNIRAEVRTVQLLLDELAAEAQKKAPILTYFGQIKQGVHFPLHALSMRLRSLPALAEASAQVEHEVESLNHAEEVYNSCRRAAILAAAAQASREAAQIEQAAEDAVANVRLLGNEEIYQVLCQYCGDRDSSSSDDSEESESSDDALPAWLYNLRRVADLPTASVLIICSSSARRQEFLGDIEELKDAVRRGWEASDLLFRTLPAETIQELLAMDGELVCAYAADWRERVDAYEELQRRRDFERAYEQLRGARTAYGRAQRKYARGVGYFNEAVAVHREANQQLGLLKDRFVEIALSEVSEEIEFVS